ncbi:gluconokinase [Hoeflea ulvae]|uniref:Gluconokinase n=1 Tax=Hoeflea ulvae TaxID=2983764 RepID=A0ABT3YH75_9HYPH|nr:gluconokinase [Hoeflea ulvae]MCY0095144.1 gluconokinase [Hoeflea ulvae]
MRCFVLMGVSGCGKTTVGEALSKTFGMTFIDGDALHPQTNIEKMSRGQPLDDADRAPWLVEVGRRLAAVEGPVVIGCSALKLAYRDLIRAQLTESVHFLHLDAPKEVLVARVAHRPGHFMPASLLDSQFADLAPLADQEQGRRIDISLPLENVLAQCETYIGDLHAKADRVAAGAAGGLSYQF